MQNNDFNLDLVSTSKEKNRVLHHVLLVSHYVQLVVLQVELWDVIRHQQFHVTVTN